MPSESEVAMITEPDTTTQATPVARDGPALSAAPVLDQERRAERRLFIDCIRDVAATVPFTVALLVGVVVLAVGRQDPDWGAWIPTAVALGIWAGLFFGLWIAFLRNAPQLQKIDTRELNKRTVLSDQNQGDRQPSGRAA
jgi:hypothetical protein